MHTENSENGWYNQRPNIEGKREAQGQLNQFQSELQRAIRSGDESWVRSCRAAVECQQAKVTYGYD